MELSNLNIYLLIIGIAIVTYIPRCLPILYLSKKDLPNWLKDWMKFIPSGVFAALILPSVLIQDGRLNLGFTNINLITSILVVIIAVKKKSLGLSIAVGVFSITLLTFII
ncbi:AzlD domain-containing protein [Clostridium vincentii]|uniref:Branched-chain amino acid transport protein AzlD n=1 Tax=Clostridium vincentii TaxID=52704 RepID=A0A2T0BJ76_9CLOT|nr:AzlD domain-containing protein [Clostridium vincentii]PRR83852.1 Branched-chain amino acid transport protein AzlD [Clostridium vincentii]